MRKRGSSRGLLDARGEHVSQRAADPGSDGPDSTIKKFGFGSNSLEEEKITGSYIKKTYSEPEKSIKLLNNDIV